MKKTITLVLSFTLMLPLVFSQSFKDDFESYGVSDYLGVVSTKWTTWSGSTGGSEDIQIVNTDAYSGTQSIYYDSPYGNGPQDIVLPFGGVHNTGKFRFKAMFKVPAGNSAYFNFQGGATIGSSWAMDFYMYDDGTFSVNKLSGSYPQDQWFEVKVEINFASNYWEVFIDNVSVGNFSSGVNAVSYLDLFGVFSNSSFWVDDVSYCLNNDCNTDIEMNNLVINPNPICSNHKADVTIDITNNGPDVAKGFLLALDMNGQSRINYNIVLDDLGAGRDTTITIPNLFRTNIIGSGLEVRAINALHDVNLMNDTVTALINVFPSPNGSSMIAGSTFQGQFNLGLESQPDLLEVNKTNTYQLLPPGGYTNANFPASWAISSVTATTTTGVVVPTGSFSFSNPTSGSNASLSFTGSSSYLDSNITFSVKLINTSNGCDSIVQRTVRIVPTPAPNFSVPAAVCLGDFVQFDNKTTVHSGFATYMWYFGDGDSSDNTNPIHEYKFAGLYAVRLVAVSSPYNISNDTIINVNVGEIPTVKFKSVNKCEGIAVEFQNQSVVGNGVMTYDWDFGDGSAHVTNTNPTHLYTAPGVYKVKLVAVANGCASQLIKGAYTFARPVAGFTTPSSPVCAKSEVVLDNTTTITSGYQGALWSFGDGGISTVKEGRHVYVNEGVYTVKLLSVSEFGCNDSITKTVAIKPAPVIDFSVDKLCNIDPSVFTNLSKDFSGVTPVYTWLFNDGTTYNTKNVTKIWDIIGPKSVTLKSDLSNGCSDEITKNYNVLIQPITDFSNNDVCDGETVHFVNHSTVSQGNINYIWDFGDLSATSNQYNPSHTYASVSTSTTFTVSLINRVTGGCDDTVRKVLTVTEIPKCDFTFAPVYVPGNRGYKFTPANTGYDKYEWYFGEGGSTVQKTPVYQYLYDGSFKVKLIAHNAAGCGCESTQTINAVPSGLSDVNIENISLFPNPVNNQLTINVAEKMIGATCVIYNSLGQVISEQLISGINTLIDTENLSNGFYTVSITNESLSFNYKVIVNH